LNQAYGFKNCMFVCMTSSLACMTTVRPTRVARTAWRAETSQLAAFQRFWKI
jgi:hypothetical protein